MEKIFEQIKRIVEKELSCSAHDMDHIMRVYNLALHLAKGENVDMDVLKAAVLLHDIAVVKEMQDFSGKTDHALLGANMAKDILKKLNFPDDKIRHVMDCIISHRFKTDNKPKTMEAKILFDADKIDALGTIGIARAFAWVGKNNAKIYKKVDDLQAYANDNMNGKINGRIQDKTKHSPQIEFEAKTKHLPEKLFTEKARKIAKERVDYVHDFLDRLEKEYLGKL